MSRHFLVRYSFEAALKIVVILSIEGLTDRMLVDTGTGVREEGLDRLWGDRSRSESRQRMETLRKNPRDKRDQCNGPFPHSA